MLQKYPSSVTALDPAAQQLTGQDQDQDQQQAQPQQAAHSTGMQTRPLWVCYTSGQQNALP